MIRVLTVMVFLMYSIGSYAQNGLYLQDPLSAKRFNIEKYAAMRGTPFFVDKWLLGTAETAKGKYEGIEMKFNVYDNTLLINKEDEPYELNEHIYSFSLNNGNQVLLFRKAKPSIDFNSDAYLQVLVEGNINLLKMPVKKLAEMSEINAGIVQTFTNSAKYYIEINNVVYNLIADKESIIKLLPSNEEKISLFIKEHKISFKKENDLIKLFNFMNTLL